MKAICIDDNWNKGSVRNPEEAPKYLQIVEVVDSITDEKGSFYVLDGFYFEYEQENFAPLSDIDETELAKQREELQTV